MFQFQVVVGLILLCYGYSVTKNPYAWGEQGRNDIQPENWKAYVMQNARFLIFAGLTIMTIGVADTLFALSLFWYIAFYCIGLGYAFYPFSRWMQEHEGTWWPWRHVETEKEKRKRQAREEKKKNKNK